MQKVEFKNKHQVQFVALPIASKEEKIFRTNIADQIVKKLKINTNPKFVVRSLNNEFSESLINKKLNTTKKEKI